MPMMPYVSPEQAMKDKADFARKGISRGRSVVALTTASGVLFVAENPSATLHKVSEIYDCIAFAAVGKYNEFEQLRVAGIRLADVKGYQYSRQDVTGRALANAYANAMGATFTDSPKPLEVELVVAEVAAEHVELYHILFDGSITDEDSFVAIGGRAEAINEALGQTYQPDMDRAAALRTTVAALEQVEERTMDADRLEVAGLDRSLGRRKFFRLDERGVAELLDAE
ncbi:proteasome subunit alpha [Euzebya tangerina]|uniref:proteasome subunit alpha n=1 Tax=Euzebya tangerina TaxID=591198 RepID=UPI000E318C6F|nr:proteasome subunit alpha [Euzebya tangerina]